MNFLPFIFSALASGVAGGMQASSAARQAELQNQRGAQGAAMQRKNFLDIIDKYRQVDFQGANARQGAAEFTNMADQIDAMTAARGTFGSGGVGSRAQQSMALSNILTGLAARNAEMQMGREQAIAQLMADPAFSTLSPEAFDPQRAAMRAGTQGFLGGLGSGVMSGLGSLMGTQSGQELLFGTGQPAAEAPGVPSSFDRPIVNAFPARDLASDDQRGRRGLGPVSGAVGQAAPPMQVGYGQGGFGYPVGFTGWGQPQQPASFGFMGRGPSTPQFVYR